MCLSLSELERGIPHVSVSEFVEEGHPSAGTSSNIKPKAACFVKGRIRVHSILILLIIIG